MFLNNAEVAKKLFLNFIFNLFFIAFMSFVTLKKKKKKEKHQVSFPSKRTEFYTWKSDIHFVLKVMQILGQKWLCSVLQETRLLLERAKFKSLVTSSYWPISNLLKKVSIYTITLKISSSIKHVYKVTNLNVTKDT